MQYLWMIVAGVCGGIIGGMGMGGGTLLIPILTILLGWSQLAAQTTNLVAFLPMALVSIVIHTKHKLVDFKALLWVTLPALATTCVASFVAPKLEGDLLQKMFGWFIAVVGVVMLGKTIFDWIKSKSNKTKMPPKSKSKSIF